MGETHPQGASGVMNPEKLKGPEHAGRFWFNEGKVYLACERRGQMAILDATAVADSVED